MTMTHEQIASVCHEANRQYCESLDDNTQEFWDDAADWQRQSAIKGVQFRQANPDAPDSATHENWMADKLVCGWKYGEVKDAEAKTHPCLVPFDQLPADQQRKDKLFAAIVRALS